MQGWSALVLAADASSSPRSPSRARSAAWRCWRRRCCRCARRTRRPQKRRAPPRRPSSHIVREAIKWRTRDAEAVAEVHGAALELLRLHARLRVRPGPRHRQCYAA